MGDLLDRRPEVQQAALAAMKGQTEDPKHLIGYVDVVVATIAKVAGCRDTRRGVDAGLDCEVRASLLASWRAYDEGPDNPVGTCFVDGSPMGLLSAPVARGIFLEYGDLHADVRHGALSSWESKKDRRNVAGGDPYAVADM